MKRTTLFLTDELERGLRELARRTRRPQAEIMREALSQYLQKEARPWPRSIGIGRGPDDGVTSENIKEWVRDRWKQELETADRGEPPPSC